MALRVAGAAWGQAFPAAGAAREARDRHGEVALLGATRTKTAGAALQEGRAVGAVPPEVLQAAVEAPQVAESSASTVAAHTLCLPARRRPSAASAARQDTWRRPARRESADSGVTRHFVRRERHTT